MQDISDQKNGKKSSLMDELVGMIVLMLKSEKIEKEKSFRE